MTAALALLRPLLAWLTVGVTIPVWLIAGAVLWWQVDKSSAVRRAVESAVEGLVDGAELAAERARNEALKKIIAEKDRRAERDAQALARFAELLSEAETEQERLTDEIAELEALPPPDACVVDRALLERLRR